MAQLIGLRIVVSDGSIRLMGWVYREGKTGDVQAACRYSHPDHQTKHVPGNKPDYQVSPHRYSKYRPGGVRRDDADVWLGMPHDGLSRLTPTCGHSLVPCLIVPIHPLRRMVSMLLQGQSVLDFRQPSRVG